MAWRPDYITLDELKNLVDVEDTVDDVFLALIPSAASDAVNRCCGRQFGIVDAPEARTYEVTYSSGTRKWRARIDDLRTTAGLVLPDGVGTGYRLGPRNAVQEGKAWTWIELDADPTGDVRGEFTMTALWGWEAVPSAVKMATMLQANRWSSRKDSPFGIAGSPDQGSELRLLKQVDPDVAVSLRDFRRDWWAA